MNTRSCPGQHFFGRAVAVALGLAPAVVPSAQPAPDDPPARVGRLASLSGTVSYHLADAGQWEPAIYAHINSYGRFDADLNRRIDLDLPIAA